MKRTQEILGLPIISISDGMEAGKVKAIVVNAEKGSVDYVVVDDVSRVMGTWVIPAEGILGIGEYALTIESAESIVDIGKVPQAVELIQKDIDVKNTRVLTKKGRLIGETADFYVDEDASCRISGLEFTAFSEKDKVRIIPRESVITFGKKLIVVVENAEETFLEDISQRTGNGGLSAEKKNPLTETAPPPVVEEVSPEAVPDELVSEAAPAAESLEEPSQIQQEASSAAENGAGNLFEQKQRQYLMGRKATKTITDHSGNVLISEDMVINDAVIDAAKLNGKLIELVMNNKA